MEFLIDLFLQFLNLGLVLGAGIGVLLLLRPLLCRICTPQQRVVLWAVVWLSAYLPWVYALANRLNLLPVTLRTLLVTRTSDFGSYAGELPAILPGRYQSPGLYHLALPGGRLAAVSLSDGVMTTLTVLWAAVALGLLWWCARRSERLERKAHEGRLLSREDPLRRGIPELERETTMIRVCKDLPTSFVLWGGTARETGASYGIYVQEELPPERMRLVLLHEAQHIRLRHCWCKMYLSGVLLYWYNPLMWLGYRCFCRDLELACDRAVLERLDGDDRREYARMLVELGSGRLLWDVPTAFGECDIARRVRAIAAWRPGQQNRNRQAAAWAACLLLGLFLAGGPHDLCRAQDILLAYQREDGGTEAFVQAVEQCVEETGAALEAEEIWCASRWSKGWLPWTGQKEEYLLVQGADGSWYAVGLAWDAKRVSFHGSDPQQLAEAPELAGCIRLV